MESLQLALSAKSSWICDLMYILAKTHYPIDITRTDLGDAEVFDTLRYSITKACDTSLLSALKGLTKLEILRKWRRWATLVMTETSDSLLVIQPFLHIPVKTHRLALTCLLFSDHNLSIERLRYAERYRPHIHRDWRLCRFCYAIVDRRRDPCSLCVHWGATPRVTTGCFFCMTSASLTPNSGTTMIESRT